MKTENGKIIEATEAELRAYFLSNGWDGLYSFDEYKRKMLSAGCVILPPPGGETAATEAATAGEFVNIYDTSNKYDIIYADPPWNYNDKNCAGAAAAQYATMKLDELAALPIPQIAAKNCVLFMWATYPKLEDAQALIKAWGFKYKSIAFQWVKLNKAADKEKLLHALQNSDSLEAALQKICFFGLGRWTRGNTEPCLIAIKGKPARVSPGVGQLIFAPLGRHSAKPPETRNKIIELTGGGMQRIELFARQHAPGFDCWGNEV